MTSALAFPYTRSRRMRDLRDRIHDCIESISLGFDSYGDEYVRGPGIYLAIVSGRTVESFAEPMGSNTWPTDVCASVSDGVDAFYEAASTVAHSCDGGVCIGLDGTILEQMVRFQNVREEDLPDGVQMDDLEYTDWMGARHMSAYETSFRPDVLTTLTLSEETGRVTTFENGRYETRTHDKIGAPWRTHEHA